MQSEHRDKVGSFLHVTRITWLYRLPHYQKLGKSFKIYILFQESMQKIQLNMRPKLNYVRHFVWMLTGAGS